MEVNERIMSNAPNAYTMPDATMIYKSTKKKYFSQNIDIRYYIRYSK